MQSAEMGLSDIIAANFVLAGALGLGACFAIVALSSAGRAGSHRGFLLPAAAIMASSVLTSHAMARLEHRLPLVFVTALHQLAAAAWLGGLPFLLMAIRLASSPDFVRQLSARFSRLALMSVAIVASAGLILSFSYVGSLRPHARSCLGRGNLRAHDSASAAPLKSCQERSARRSLCRPKKGLRDGIAFHGIFCPRAIRHAPQHSRREGLVRVQPSFGGDHCSFRRFLAVLAQTRRISWVSNWPLLFLGLSIFLFLRSDPEVWPLGPNGFWVTLRIQRSCCTASLRRWSPP